MTIRWVLFDADGVLQQMPSDWQASLVALLGDDPAATLKEIFDAEREQAMTGGDFTAVLTGVLRRRQLEVDPQVVLQSWRSLEVDPDLTARIRQLRAAGIGCALATNQQNVRVAHMRSMPEYATLFDEQFYSSEIGAAKPDPAFFTAIIDRLTIEADQALFIDDVADNVAGARVAGLQAEVFAKSAGLPELERILQLHDVGA